MQHSVGSKLRGRAWTPLSLLLIAGCSFDVSALPGQRRPSPEPVTQHDSGADAPAPGGRMSNEPADAGTQLPDRPPMQTDAAQPAPEPEDAQVDAQPPEPPLDAGVDAAVDASVEPEEDAAVPDAAVPEPMECDPDLPCVCPHLLEQSVADGPCVCALAACAPDDDCRLLVRGPTRYYFCEDERTWEQARARCDDVPGLQLAAIESSDEDEFILANVTDKTWLGASDGQVEGTWRWIGGAVFYDEEEGDVGNAYVNWHSSEPNNDGLSESPADCLLLWYENSVWADASCDDAHGYVCEVDP